MNSQESRLPSAARNVRGEHGVLWGIVIALVVTFATGIIVGKTVIDNNKTQTSELSSSVNSSEQ